jgi:hypothetical protein
VVLLFKRLKLKQNGLTGNPLMKEINRINSLQQAQVPVGIGFGVMRP